jgi:hypothetical protein
MNNRQILLLLCFFTLYGCTSNEYLPDSLKDWRHAEWNPWAEPKPQPVKPPPPEKPVNKLLITQLTSFRGVIPCSDCEKIELILTLRPDRIFFLRKDFKRLPERRKDQSQELGGWLISKNGRELVLKRGDGSSQRFAIINGRQLEILNAEGKPIDNNGDYRMARLDTAIQLIDSYNLQGLYYENAGRGYWEECQSGIIWPVARSGDYVNLSEKYNAAIKPTPTSAVGAEVIAHLTKRQEDGNSTTEYLVVDEYKSINPSRSCSR